MQTENHSGSRFFLRTVILGLLALCAIAPSLRCSQSPPVAETSIARECKGAPAPCAVSLTLIAPLEAVAGQEFGVAVEDPDEIGRCSPRHPRRFAADYAPAKLGRFFHIALTRRSILSPPLLV